MRNYNFDEHLVQVIQALHANSDSVVLLNNQLEKLFRTTVGVGQGCLLSSVLFNIFLENIMQETVQVFNSTLFVGGRPICNLRFADDVELMGRSENFKTPPPDWKKRQELMGWKSAKKKAKYLSTVPNRIPLLTSR